MDRPAIVSVSARRFYATLRRVSLQLSLSSEAKEQISQKPVEVRDDDETHRQVNCCLVGRYG